METNIFIKSWKQGTDLESVDFYYDNGVVTLSNMDGNGSAIETIKEWSKKAPLYKTSDLDVSDKWVKTSAAAIKSGNIVRTKAYFPDDAGTVNVYAFQRQVRTRKLISITSAKNITSGYYAMATSSGVESIIIAMNSDNTKILAMYYIDNNNTAGYEGLID